MKYNISDPTEGGTYAGYWSIEVIDHSGDVIADIHLSGSSFDGVVEDFIRNPDELREIADILEAVPEVVDP